MIDGVKVSKRFRYKDERGEVMHIMKQGDESFQKFGDVYCSTIKNGIIKGWNYHKKSSINYTVIRGLIKLVLFDLRTNSPTIKKKLVLSLSIDNYCSVFIPPQIWYAFKGVSKRKAYVINFMDLPYDPNDILKMNPYRKNMIDYTW